MPGFFLNESLALTSVLGRFDWYHVFLCVLFAFSEVHAAESVAYLNRAQVRLQVIWEEIGIPEEQRIQRTNDVHKHIKVSLTFI